jgi:pyruvate/2-oxoglutarate dehydrogenase complex dihydrolipoamide acyltransferase (E2) component
METDKVETEIECEDEGILVVTAEPGLEAPIGTTIGYIVSSVGEVDEARARGTGS